MNIRLLAAAVVAVGVAAGFGAGAATKPLWSYHNGNTLLGKATDYREGYFIGVVDGYLRAHERRAYTAENGDWLDRCLSGGWTTGRVIGVMDAKIEGSVRRLMEPIATVLLDGVKEACDKRK